MKFLLFQIYAPLVSWGEIAVGGERLSARYPSKSAIIGLVAAALGIRREEEERLSSLANALGFSVELHSAGSILKDYHTTQVPKKEGKVVHYTRRSELLAPSDKIGTILSSREYRCDALAIVAIYLKDDTFTLDEIQKSLREPTFHLYFGRKSSAPALPLAPKIVESTTLKEAFGQYCVDFISPIDETKPEWLQNAFSQYPSAVLSDKIISYFWEDGVDMGFSSVQSIERYDQPSSRKRWQFNSRRENMAIVNREELTDVLI